MKSGMGRGLRPSAVTSHTRPSFWSVGSPTTGWMLEVTFGVISPPILTYVSRQSAWRISNVPTAAAGVETLPQVSAYPSHRLGDTPAVQRRADTCASFASAAADQGKNGLACSGGTPGRRLGRRLPTRHPAKRARINEPTPSATTFFIAVLPYLIHALRP